MGEKSVTFLFEISFEVENNKKNQKSRSKLTRLVDAATAAWGLFHKLVRTLCRTIRALRLAFEKLL